MSGEPEAAIRQAVLDYFEGWFAGDPARMRRALHPRLAKRGSDPDSPDGIGSLTAAEMIESTAAGTGRSRGTGDRNLEIRIDDVHEDIANVTATSTVYREYLQLVRTTDGWRIVNTLWRPA